MVTMNAGLVIPMRLTSEQDAYARRAVGVARAVYNWCVASEKDSRAPGLWLHPFDLQRELNSVKHNPTHPMHFITELPYAVTMGAYNSFCKAYRNWRNTKLRARQPRFHKKRRTGEGSFLAGYGTGRIPYDGHKRLRLQGLGWVKLACPLLEGEIYGVTVRRRNGQWLASIALRRPEPKPDCKTHAAGGLDVGINPLAVDSDGEVWGNPKAYYAAQRKLRRWQRAQARRTVESCGWREAQKRIDRINRRIVGIRSNAHHQLSRRVVRKFATLGIETLNVSGMDKLRWQAKAIRDAAIGGLLEKIRYKAKWYGTAIVEADRWYPSSKTCGQCGSINSNLGRELNWTCPGCGAQQDRNHNAARNLQKLALSAISGDVTLPDEKALAASNCADGETGSDEGRTVRTGDNPSPGYSFNTQLPLLA